MATKYGFYINTDICIGCKACMTACFDCNDLQVPQQLRKVWEFGGGGWQQDGDGAYTSTAFCYYVSLTCNQCDAPACVADCPTGAMGKDENSGIVSVDAQACIGCGICTTSCPYHHPQVFADGKAHKCVQCSDHGTAGIAPEPVCARACPLRALEFGNLEGLRALYGSNNEVAGLPDVTGANVVISLHRNASLGGQLLNSSELGG
jgi:anaerobic dimethyl sulfoxide reductase subunit B (iron-sulfur subunit)